MNRVAAIQMVSGSNLTANLHEASRLIKEAAAAGAKLVVLPEYFALMGMQQTDVLSIQETFGEGPLQTFLAQQAIKNQVWIVGGTIPLKSHRADKVKSACLLYNNQGQYVLRYDKMHLFDVTATPKECYYESQVTEPGEQIATIDTPFGRLGLAICYDLRFPELFRCMIDKGVEIITVPAAFTATTGKAHWEILVRSRALENQCYLIAADQGGYHVNGRETYGDSMIVDPWGLVLTRIHRGTGVVYADMDKTHLTHLRQIFPTLRHRKIICKENCQQRTTISENIN